MYIYMVYVYIYLEIIIQTFRSDFYLLWESKVTKWPKMTQNEKYLCHQQLLSSKTPNDHVVWYTIRN